MKDVLLKVEGLSKHFALPGGRRLAALADVSLELTQGETLGIVGESGCGKSTLARTIMGVLPPDGGQMHYRGEAISLRNRRERLAYAKKVQMVFQDPYASLDPRMTIASILAEGLEIQLLLDSAGRRERAYALLELVGLEREHAGRFPHEFSGGQRQRIAIARALAVQPELLICDEPISALDLSVQSQIMNLLQRLQRELGLTYLFIAHDLSMVRYLSSRIAVMYMGRVVELADSQLCLRTPLHPYTKMLLKAELSAAPGQGVLDRGADVRGEVQRAQVQSGGCPFAPRCDQADDGCRGQRPQLLPVGDGHLVACHKAGCAPATTIAQEPPLSTS